MVSGRMAGAFLEIRVADDGIGIDGEFLPYVFDRFRQIIDAGKITDGVKAKKQKQKKKVVKKKAKGGKKSAKR